MIPLFKKGDKKECSNYRGITTESHILKGLSKLMHNRLDDFCEKKQKYKETQNGFRRNRSRQELILIVRILQTSHQEKNLPLYMGFVDIMKAYDSVQQELLWKILKQIGLPPRFIKMTKLIYNSIECKVKIGGKYSEPFRVLTGLLQGNCTSTDFFNIFFCIVIEVTLQRLQNTGVQMRCRFQQNFFKALKSTAKGEVFTILELLFADDTLFCTNTEQDLQLVIETFSEVCGWFGIQISVKKKTEVMIQRPLSDPTLQDPDITINGEQLSVCSSFKYLGNMITNDALLNVEIKTRIGQATAAFSKLFQRVWSNKSLSLKTKISTYKTSVLPILIQDCETWHCKKTHFKKLEGCQYRFLRTIIGKKWEDFISYLSIFEILETKKISITAIEPLVRMKRLQCLCKILKMDNSRGLATQSRFF